MSGSETHEERRQEVAGSGQADTSTKVQVTITTNDPNKVSVTKHDVDESGRTEKSTNIVSDSYDKGKEKVSDVKSKMSKTINMKSLMKHARYSLSDLMNPLLTVEKQIPVELLKNAFGLFFLTEIKGSMIIGASMGLGIIIARKPNGEGWTGPCAIGMGGVSIGFQIGMEKVEHMFILHDKEALKPFINNNQYKLGTDVSFAVGPIGRDANIAVNVNDKGYAAIYSYSMTKGGYVGSSLEGQVITIRDDCNEEYYGKKVSARDILHDKIDVLPHDEEYLSLVKLIEEYMNKKGQLYKEQFSNEDKSKDEEFWENIKKSDSNKPEHEQQGYKSEKTDTNIEEDKSKKEENKSKKNEEDKFKKEEYKFKKEEDMSQQPKKSKVSETYSKGKQMFESGKERAQEAYESGKEQFQQMYEFGKEKMRNRFTLDRLLKHARFSLENIMNPKIIKAEQQIPVKLLNNALALIFLTEFKGGFGVGGSIGEGFIISRTSDENEWSQPCAIGMGGASFGFQLGMQKTDHIFVVHDEKVLKTFTSQGQLKLGGDFSFSLGPFGRDVNAALNVGEKGYAPIYSYSMARGMYFGATLEGQLLMIRDDCNEEYFGHKVNVNDILSGKLKPPSMNQTSPYYTLTNLLNEYIENQGQLKNIDSFWNEQDRKDDKSWFSSDNEKQTSNVQQEEHEEQVTMRRLLTKANESLENFVNPNLSIEKQIPIRLLSDAYAIVFLTEIKAGLFVGASMGTGIIIARRLNQGKKEWTGPCGIALSGMSVGFQVGMQSTDHIIVLRDEKVLKTFTAKGELKIGGDASFSIGPLGRDANIALNVSDKGYSAIYSYSMSKGAYIGTSFEGQLITIRNDCNEEYYGKRVSASEILFGNVEPPKEKEFNLLCENLNKYISFRQHQIEDYSQTTNVDNKSNTFRVVTDIHKEEIHTKDTSKLTK